MKVMKADLSRGNLLDDDVDLGYHLGEGGELFEDACLLLLLLILLLLLLLHKL